MFTCEIVLVAALLTSNEPVYRTQVISIEPGGRACVEPGTDIGKGTALLSVLRPTILAVCIDMQIADPREQGCLLTQEPVCDLAMLQSRYVEFAGLPPLEDCLRFPTQKFVTDMLAQNRSFRAGLEARLQLDEIHALVIRDAIVETDQCYQVWDSVRDASCSYYYVTVRRQSLGALRSLIGAESYYAGQLPPWVPMRHVPRQ